tara:strand:+ start:115 stop:780 length:666 start_codon:yes stop_codon:yes gene_type:complete
MITIKEKNKDQIYFVKKNKKKENNTNPCIFFDRDGVIIEDCHYIKNPKDVKLCPGAKELLKYLYDQNKLIILITNQSGISKKLLTWEDYKKVSDKLIQLLGDPNPISAIYANSYSNDSDGTWRKPKPGMIKQAARDFAIDLESSILIGDRQSDLDAGLNAGIKKLVHVLTGHGSNERKLIESRIDGFANYKYGKKNSKLFFVPNLIDLKKLITKSNLFKNV